MAVQWLGEAATVGQVRLRAPGRGLVPRSPTSTFFDRAESSLFSFTPPPARAPQLREPPSRYSFSLVRVLPDCRELVAWSEGPLTLTRAQADARWAQTIPRVTGVGMHPGEGLELRMLRSGRVVKTHPFRQRPAACAGSVVSGGDSGRVSWLGQAGCSTPPCPGGTIKQYDPTCLSGTVRCVSVTPGTLEPCPGSDVVFSDKAGRCVPVRCPSGTVRNDRDECQVVVRTRDTIPTDYCALPPLYFLSQEVIGRFEACWNGRCSTEQFLILVSDLNDLFQTAATSNQPAIVAQIQFARDLLVTGGAGKCPTTAPPVPDPAPGECLSPQQVLVAQPCFYFDAQGSYVGPPELVQGVDVSQLFSFCLQSLRAGYFDLPLCDAPATIPAPPSCLSPEERGVLRYCREMDQRPIADPRRGWSGPNRTANYFCWTAFKAPAEFGEWEAAPDCQPGAPPVPPPAEVPPGEPPVPGTVPVAVSTAKKSSAVVPVLIGAAAVAAAVYFLS